MPFIKQEYFQEKENQITFDILNDFINKYNAFPTKEALLIDLSNKTGINEQLFNKTKDLISILNQKVKQILTGWWILQNNSVKSEHYITLFFNQ